MSNPTRFSDVRKKLEANGWNLTRTKGSHHVFTGENRQSISIPVHGGRVKAVYGKQIDKAIRDLKRREEED